MRVGDPKIVVLTGGPGGGKSSFLADIRRDPDLVDRVVILPEAIHAAMRSSVGPHEPLFQRLVVNLQKGIEQAMAQSLDGEDRVLLTHRGTLDPLAFCLANGWTEELFLRTTGVCLAEEYRRYYGVIHLVSTAVGAQQFYRFRPEEHRPETPGEAAILDEHLGRIWGQHPRYHRIDNDTLDWPTKSQFARAALLGLIHESGMFGEPGSKSNP
jgi:predicted ATPase